MRKLQYRIGKNFEERQQSYSTLVEKKRNDGENHPAPKEADRAMDEKPSSTDLAKRRWGGYPGLPLWLPR